MSRDLDDQTLQQLREFLAGVDPPSETGDALGTEFARAAIDLELVTPAVIEQCREAGPGEERLTLGQRLVRRRHLSAAQLVQVMTELRLRQGGRRLGKYTELVEIGRGGMGVVYEAYDPELRRNVALKVLTEFEGQERLDRLHREAVVIAQLSHPNIIGIHEVGKVTDESAGTTVHFIAMELVRGRTLADAIGRLPLDEALAMLEQVADGVAHAHERGVIHRDLKPANILLGADARVAVADFGLARWCEEPARLTQTGAVMGTAPYMAPEQVMGGQDRISPATDVWALGVMLYEILTGVRPFQGPNLSELYTAILTRDPLAPRRRDRRVPRDLETICLQALEKDAGRRYATAGALRADLACWRAGEPIAARPASVLYRMRKRLARRKGALALVGGLALICAALVGLLWWTKKEEVARARGEAAKQVEQAHGELVAELERRTDEALQAALALRRAGDVAGMQRFAKITQQACRKAIRLAPQLAEPHYRLGRMYRALMHDEAALAEQELATRKQPDHAAAHYERVVLLAARLRERGDQLVQSAWRKEGMRLATIGGGRAQAGVAIRAPNRRDLLRSDPQAARLRRRLEQDLRRIEQLVAAGKQGIGSAELAAAAGLKDWVAGQSGQAFARLAEAAKQKPGLEEVHEALATLELERGNFNESIALWTEGIERDQGYVRHREGRCQALVVQAQAEGSRGAKPDRHLRLAIEDAGRAIELFPRRHRAWALRGLARTLFGFHRINRGEDPRGLFAKALGDFDEAARRSPSDGEIEGWRGWPRCFEALHLINRGEDPEPTFRDAIAELSRAVARHPERAEFWAFRAEIRILWLVHQWTRGKVAQDLLRATLADAEEALKRFPGAARSWTTRGVARVIEGVLAAGRGDDPAGSIKLALEDLAQAIHLRPVFADPWLWRGIAQMLWGRHTAGSGNDPLPLFSSALADFNEALRRNPENVQALARRGELRIAWGIHQASREDPSALFRAAIVDLDQALKINPRMLFIRQQRGEVFARLGVQLAKRGQNPTAYLERAIQDLDQVISVGGKLALAWSERGTARAFLGQYRIQNKQDGASQLRAALWDFKQAIRLKPELGPALAPAIATCRRLLQR